jgi:hypothetical protein
MSRSIALLAVLLWSAACSAPQSYRADAGVMVIQTHGHVSLQNSAGTLVLANNVNELQGDLGLGHSEAAPYLRVEGNWGEHRVKVSGFGFEQNGDGRLDHDFGDLPAGAAVRTTLNFLNVDVAYSYDLLQDATWRLAPGVQAGYYAMKVGADSQVPVGFEEVNTDVIVPEVYIEGEGRFGPLALRSDLGAMTASLRDASGRWLDFEFAADLDLGEFRISGGYRHIVMDAHGHANDRDFDADIYLVGFFVTAGVRF